jgi:hypothetical protein
MLANGWQMGFNSTFKGLSSPRTAVVGRSCMHPASFQILYPFLQQNLSPSIRPNSVATPVTSFSPIFYLHTSYVIQSTSPSSHQLRHSVHLFIFTPVTSFSPSLHLHISLSQKPNQEWLYFCNSITKPACMLHISE